MDPKLITNFRSNCQLVENQLQIEEKEKLAINLKSIKSFRRNWQLVKNKLQILGELGNWSKKYSRILEKWAIVRKKFNFVKWYFYQY